MNKLSLHPLNIFHLKLLLYFNQSWKQLYYYELFTFVKASIYIFFHLIAV